MRTIIALSLLLASLVDIHAADGARVTGNIGGKKLELARTFRPNWSMGNEVVSKLP